jgi:hypothetical protein
MKSRRRPRSSQRSPGARGAVDILDPVGDRHDPPGDLHAPAGYRKHVAGVLLRRAVAEAFPARGQAGLITARRAVIAGSGL